MTARVLLLMARELITALGNYGKMGRGTSCVIWGEWGSSWPGRSQPQELRLLLTLLDAESEALPSSAPLKGPLFPGRR